MREMREVQPLMNNRFVEADAIAAWFYPKL